MADHRQIEGGSGVFDFFPQPGALALYDGLEPLDAAASAWMIPGPRPDYHERSRDLVRTWMPLLGRALDRLHNARLGRAVLGGLVVGDVVAEAIRAHDKHKDKGGSLLYAGLGDTRRIAALGEEYGEVCRELTYENAADETRLYTELIQTASVALTWAEYLRRKAEAGRG